MNARDKEHVRTGEMHIATIATTASLLIVQNNNEVEQRSVDIQWLTSVLITPDEYNLFGQATIESVLLSEKPRIHVRIRRSIRH
jgi:hypothetical protein